MTNTRELLRYTWHLRYDGAEAAANQAIQQTRAMIPYVVALGTPADLQILRDTLAIQEQTANDVRRIVRAGTRSRKS